jgi:nicotinic acid mononucleotide adenylyltransferase
MTSTFIDEKEPLKQTSTIIFTIARMNPPTPGHLNVIKELIKKAIETNDKIMEEDTNKTKVTDVYIILSKTMDNDENPIPCNEKIDVLGRSKDVVDSMVHSLKEEMMTEAIEKEKINNINVVCICVDDTLPSPFQQLGRLIHSYGNVNVDLFIIIGDDREKMISDIESVFKTNQNVLSISGKLLTRENMEIYKQLDEDQLREINISKIPREAFSASFVRKLVKYELDDQFKNVYLPYLKNEDKIDELYNSILKGFKVNNPPKKTKKKTSTHEPEPPNEIVHAKSYTKRTAPAKKGQDDVVNKYNEDGSFVENIQFFDGNDVPKEKTTKKTAPAKQSTKKNAPAKKRKQNEDDEDVYEEDGNEPHYLSSQAVATRGKKAKKENTEIITGGGKRKRLRKTKNIKTKKIKKNKTRKQENKKTRNIKQKTLKQ